MRLRFIDTNVFLRHLTGDDKIKAQHAFALMTRLENGTEKATTSPLVLFEVVFTLGSTYKLPKHDVARIVSAILSFRGLQIPGKQLWYDAFTIWLEYPIDFADAYNVAFMQAHGLTELYTWDRGYNHVPKIKSFEPASEHPEDKAA